MHYTTYIIRFVYLFSYNLVFSGSKTQDIEQIPSLFRLLCKPDALLAAKSIFLYDIGQLPYFDNTPSVLTKKKIPLTGIFSFCHVRFHRYAFIMSAVFVNVIGNAVLDDIRHLRGTLLSRKQGAGFFIDDAVDGFVGFVNSGNSSDQAPHFVHLCTRQG